MLRAVAAAVATTPAATVTRVAIDGVDGAGKTCFADEPARLASVIVNNDDLLAPFVVPARRPPGGRMP